MAHDGAASLVSDHERAVLYSLFFFEADTPFPDDDELKEATWEACQVLKPGPG